MKDRKKAPPFHECELRLLMKLYCDSYEEYHGRGKHNECKAHHNFRHLLNTLEKDSSFQQEDVGQMTRKACWGDLQGKCLIWDSTSAPKSKLRSDFELTANECESMRSAKGLVNIGAINNHHLNYFREREFMKDVKPSSTVCHHICISCTNAAKPSRSMVLPR